MKRRILAVFAMILAAVLVQPTAAFANGGTAPAPGTVRVQLEVPEGFVPFEGQDVSLEGLTVSLQPTDFSQYGQYFQGESNASGMVELVGVTPGEYSLAVHEIGVHGLIGGMYKNGVFGQWNGTPVTVGSDGLTLSAEFSRGSVVEAHVVDPLGSPIEGAYVSFEMLTNPHNPSWGLGAGIPTDSSGRAIATLGWGTHAAFVSSWRMPQVGGYWVGNDQALVSNVAGATVIAVNEQLVPSHQNLVMRTSEGATASGVVTLSSTNEPVADATVTVEGVEVTTDADGAWAVQGLSPGNHTVLIEPAGRFEIPGYLLPDGTVGARMYGNEYQLVVNGTTPITGVNARLTTGGAIDGTVNDLAEGERFSISYTGSFEGSSQQLTSSEFHLNGIPAGTAFLRFTNGDPNSDRLIQARELAIHAGVVAEPTFEVVTGGSISGSVRGADGQAVASGRVTAWSPSGAGSSGSATIDAAGNFVVRGLDAGSYIVSVMSGQSSTTVTDVSVVLGERTVVPEIRFGVPTVIEVTVLDSQGQPLAERWVSASPVNGGGQGASTVTNEAGIATVVVGSHGSYFVSVSDATGSVANGPRGHKTQIVTVSDTGTTTPFTMTMGGAQVNLQVISDGAPLVGESVTLQTLPGETAQGDYRSAVATTGVDGRVSFDVEPGQYRAYLPTVVSPGSSSYFSGLTPQSGDLAVQAGVNEFEVSLDTGYSLVVDTEALFNTGAFVQSPIVELQGHWTSVSGSWPYSPVNTFTNLVPGTYLVSAYVDGELRYSNGVTDPALAEPIVLSPSQKTATVVFATAPPTSADIAGAVTAGGQPLVGAEITAAVDGETVATATTDTSGAYLFADAEAGEVTLTATWGEELIASEEITLVAGADRQIDLEADTDVVRSLVRIEVALPEEATGEYTGAITTGDVTAPVVSGIAQFVNLPAGDHSFLASGDARFTDGYVEAGGALSEEPVLFTVDADTAYQAIQTRAEWSTVVTVDVTGVTPDDRALTFGDTVEIAATFAHLGAPLTGGTAELMLDGDAIASALISPTGEATLTTDALPAGSQSVLVRFTDELRFGASEPVTFAVAKAPSSVEIGDSTEEHRWGTPVELPVTVTGAAVSSGDTVRILDGEEEVAQATIAADDLTETGAELTVEVPTGATGLQPGLTTLTAAYSGNRNLLASTSDATIVGVLVPTTVTATAPAVAAGVDGELTVEVNPTANVGSLSLGGTVTVTAPGWAQPLQGDVTDGRAVIELPARGVGDTALTVSYNGTSAFGKSSAATTWTVRAANSSVDLSLSVASVAYGDAVSAEVAVAIEGGSEASGTVVISRATAGGAPTGDPLGSAVLEDGEVSIALPRLDAGTSRLVATFAPSSVDVSGSSSDPAELEITPIQPSLDLALEADSVAWGQPVRGQVSASALGAAVEGELQVVLGSTPATVTATADGWTFEAPTAGLTAVGDLTVRATLTPTSANYTDGSDDVVVTITKAAAALEAQVDRERVSVDDAPAVLSVAVPNAPSGEVTLDWGAGATPVALDAAGEASYTLPRLAVGEYTVTVSFAGSATLAAAEVEVPLEVSKVTGEVTADDLELAFGEAAVLDVRFLGVPEGATAPTGTVSVLSVDTEIATGQLVEGAVQISLPAPAVGTSEVTVVYPGDARFAPSQHTATVVVTKASVTLDVDWPAAQTVGAVNGTVDVTVVPGAGLPTATGSIRLLVDGEPMVAHDLDNGGAALPLPVSLGGGTHTLAVEYLGNDSYAPASANGTVLVSAAATVTSVSAAGSAEYGDQVPVDVSVSSAGGVVTGQVTVRAGAETQFVTLTDGAARVTLDSANFGASGAVEISASYNGTADFAPSTAATQLQVSTLATNTSASLRSSTVPGAVLEIATLVTASVTPVGTVTATSDTGPTLTGTLVGGRATLQVPASLADGRYEYVVSYPGGIGFDASQSAALSFTLSRTEAPAEPGGTTVQPAQREVPAGEQQTVTIDGLEPGEVIHVFIYSDPVYVGSATADANGIARLTFTVPANLVPGDHRIEARTSTGIVSAWISVAAAPGGTADGSTAPIPAAGGLSQTGGPDLTAPVLAFAAVMMLLGAALVVQRRRAVQR